MALRTDRHEVRRRLVTEAPKHRDPLAGEVSIHERRQRPGAVSLDRQQFPAVPA